MSRLLLLVSLLISLSASSQLMQRGDNYLSVSDYTSAVTCYEQCLTMAKTKKDDRLTANIYEKLAGVFLCQCNNEKAFEYAKLSLSLYRSMQDDRGSIIPLALLGDYYINIEKNDSALYYYKKAFTLTTQYNDSSKRAFVLNELAVYYALDSNYDMALVYATEARRVLDHIGGSIENSIDNNSILAYCYLQLSKSNTPYNGMDSAELLRTAKRHFEDAAEKSKTINYKKFQSLYQEDLAELYSITGEYKKAYYYLKGFQQAADSIFSQENKNKIAALENQREMDKKNQEIETQKRNVRETKKNIAFLLSGLIAVIIVGLLFYRLSAVRKQRNKELLILNDQLDKANSAKAGFFAILTHDLRSPIANLVNFLHLQQNKSPLLTAEQKDQQQKKITQSATSLLDVMEGMLLWSKGQMENFKPLKTPVSVASLFDYLQNLYQTVTDIEFTFQAEKDLVAYTDENYLKAILYNLTQNAINALKQTSQASITWRAWREDDTVRMSITDNGPGMTAAQRSMFEKNIPIDSSKHGMGLHIIKDMAKAIGCRITVNSSGAGTLVVLDI